MARLPSEVAQNFGDDLAPNFALNISGKDTSNQTALFDAVRPLVQSMMFEEDEEMSSKFELTLINQPGIAFGQPVNWREVVDSKAFQEGNFIDLFLGYGNTREYVDRVEIVKWLPDFPASGPATFTIKGYDGRHRMQRGNLVKQKKKRKTFYKNKPDELIVKEIAAKYGFGVDTDTTEVTRKTTTTTSRGRQVKKHVIPTRVQAANMSDWQFLKKLAAINRFDLWVDYDRTQQKWIVNFKKRAEVGLPLFSFEYNGGDGSLLSAEPDFSIHEQPTDVEVLYFDRKKRSVELTVIADQNRSENVKLGGNVAQGSRLQAQKQISSGARVRFTAFGQTIDAFSNKPFRSNKEAKNFVEHWLREREREMMILKGVVVGVPSMRARQIHEFKGMSNRIDGFYRITNVIHKQAPGSLYTCEFTAHKILSDSISRKPITSKPSGRTNVVTKENRKGKFGAPI